MIELLQRICECEALFAVPCRHFCNQHSGKDSVLVANLLAGSTADALLVAEEIGIALLFKLRDAAADILKARQRLEDMDAVGFADDASEVSGHNGFDHRGFRGKSALCLLAFCHVSDEKGTGLIAV